MALKGNAREIMIVYWENTENRVPGAGLEPAQRHASEGF